MTIVVGVDQTTESGHALDLAVHEAELRGADLRIVHVGDPTTAQPAEPALLPDPPSAQVSEAATAVTLAGFDQPSTPATIIEEALARARRTLAPHRVAADVLPGRPAKVLVEQVTALDLLVIGSRNLRSARSVLTGSVGSAVSAHAPCPVIVARHAVGAAPVPISRVLAGTDRSSHADRTLEFAFAEAQLRDVPLEVVCCWRQHGFLTPYEQRQITEQLRDQVEHDLVSRQRRYPGVRATGDVFEGNPSDILSGRADESTLLVIGARGAGGVIGSLVLGSVSRSVLHHARCPVAVVRPPR